MGFCTRTGRAEIPIPPPETKGRKKVVSCEQTLQSLVFSHTHTPRITRVPPPAAATTSSPWTRWPSQPRPMSPTLAYSAAQVPTPSAKDFAQLWSFWSQPCSSP